VEEGFGNPCLVQNARSDPIHIRSDQFPYLMAATTKPPRGFDNWLRTLTENGMGARFQSDIASVLRVFAGTKNGGVTLAAGTQSIPYVDWVQDGMAMTCRLILHSTSKKVADLIQPHFSTDIRIATHLQDFSMFLSDIEEHRFDLILLDVDEVTARESTTVVDRLTDYGLLVGFGDRAELEDLIRRCADSHFCSRLGASDHCVALSRKGLQHRAVRRGGRRRHSHVS
jgi:hypothetical protein